MVYDGLVGVPEAEGGADPGGVHQEGVGGVRLPAEEVFHLRRCAVPHVDTDGGEWARFKVLPDLFDIGGLRLAEVSVVPKEIHQHYSASEIAQRHLPAVYVFQGKVGG